MSIKFPRTVLQRLQWLLIYCVWIALGLVIHGRALATEPPPWLLESVSPSPQMRLVWQTEPGVRYDLQRSDNLSLWNQVPGFPVAAGGLSQQFVFTPGPQGFFRFYPIDEQPPIIISQYPAVNGFAVKRSSVISLQLGDASGIDPASIRLTVGASGPLSLASAGMSFSDGVLTFDPGSTPLGAYGETVTVTLVAADTKGNTLTRTWSFTLEPEPLVAPNIVVFGSATALRTGQQVRGPARSLASRFASGPIAMDATSAPWNIESILTDRIVIAYSQGNAPTFSNGQLVCNLTPTTEAEIFYRRVLSVSDDPTTSHLTLMTEDADLSAFITQGAVSFSSDAAVFPLSRSGVLQPAIQVNADHTFPKLGIDLSGTHIKLGSNNDFEATVLGVTYSQGSSPTLLDVSASELSWWMTPRVELSFEMGFGLKSFEAIANGTMSFANAFDVKILALGLSTKTTIYALPAALEPKYLIIIPVLGVPVITELSFGFKIETEADAQALLNFSFAYRQNINSRFGLTYQQPSTLNLVSSFQEAPADLQGNVALTGEFSLDVRLVPGPKFLVYGVAGFSADIEPHVGITVDASTNGTLDGHLDAGVDLTLQPAGPLLEPLFPDTQFSVPIWQGSWPLVASTLAFKTQPTGKTVVTGDNVALTCSVTSSSPASFQWFYNGLAIPGQTAASLFLSNVNSGYAGSYFVRAKAGGQSLDSSPAVLAVQIPSPSPTPTPPTSTPSSTYTPYIAAGDDHSLFIRANGTLWAMGRNIYGQLGDGTTIERNNPVQVATGVSQVVSGFYHSLFMTANGALWCMGRNNYGQFGDSTTTNHYSPVQIATGISQVAAGSYTTFYIKSDGTLWAMGRNDYGQLGDGTTTNRYSPVQIATGVSQVAAAGYFNSFYIKSDGTLWAMGRNDYGQLGDGTTIEHHSPVQVAAGVSQIVAGEYHSLFMTANGALWCMGRNNFGQLGDGTTTDRHSPVQITVGVSQVAAAGYADSFYIKKDGTLWAIGRNTNGQLGDGTTTDRHSSVQVATGVSQVVSGTDHCLYIESDGTLWATGRNNYGQLGDGTTVERHGPIQVTTGVGVTQSAARIDVARFRSSLISIRPRSQ